MVPASYNVLDKMPLSTNGKIDRQALAQLPVVFETASAEKRTQTDSPLERLLLAAWADVLNLSDVGLDDDFFELGGNSLKAMALTHRLQQRLNRTIRPVAVMQFPTVARFAAYLDVDRPEQPAHSAAAAMEEGEI